MLKILYAASANENAKIQLARFLQVIQGKAYTVKIAAYKISSPSGLSIDWTLDSLKNIFRPEFISIRNDNFQTYFEQIKYYNPDLIISDMEYYTSYIANVLNIPLWQCSSSLIYSGLTPYSKHDIGFQKQYYHLMEKDGTHDLLINILENSQHRFIYSHLGDLSDPPQLKTNYEWIRPYHDVGKNYLPCRHNIVGAMFQNNKHILNLLKKYHDSVVFSNFTAENYDNILLKDINNTKEYICNLYNSQLFFCQGQTSFLADAYYNKKYVIVMVNFEDTECVINALFSEKFQLSHTIYDIKEDLNPYFNISIESNYNKNIKYLHEKIEER